jgi:hypothetical protein
MRYIVIDIEASGFDGFPIEFGWCDQDGNGESHLIRPPWNWVNWDIRAERIHGISRELLAAQGEPHEAVAQLIADMLMRCRRQHVVVASDNPKYDCEWFGMLLRRADIQDRVHLVDVAELYALAVKHLFVGLPEDCHPEFTAAHRQAEIQGEAIIQAAKVQVTGRPKHRAAADARRLRDIIETIKAEAIKAKNQESRG